VLNFLSDELFVLRRKLGFDEYFAVHKLERERPFILPFFPVTEKDAHVVQMALNLQHKLS
jgi:hypothetical protein